ncbi:MAG: alpha/beta fold hydrolase [Synechococcaceae cyanobacterium SM2_3_1]|nr:alpha/beta fold hydrolase [Synechococcaceae cyanobacterium SM2_3_1]
MAVTTSTIPTAGLSRQSWTWKGHTICYTREGSGPPLLLVHGFGASIGHWRKNIPVLAAAGYRVFALDLLGFGASDKPPVRYSLDLWVELLQDFWAAHIQEPTIFIGNSIGALMSLRMVVEHPQSSAGGILLNCAGGLSHRPKELQWGPRMIMTAFNRLVTSRITGPLLFHQIRQKHRIRATLQQVYRNPDAITDELVEILYQPACTPGAQQAFASIITAPPGKPPELLLPDLQRPLLVLWGEADPWTPVTRGQTFASHVPPEADFQFIPIPDTGHCPHDERPEVVNPLILNWLQKLNG